MSDQPTTSPFAAGSAPNPFGVTVAPPVDPADVQPFLVGQCPDCGKTLRGFEMLQHWGEAQVPSPRGGGKTETKVVPVCAACAEKRFNRLQREQERAQAKAGAVPAGTS